MKRALITGITGQDGSYLADLLLEKGYEVHGIARRVALADPEARLWRLQHVLGRVHLHSGSIENYASVVSLVDELKPDECYHLAAQSFVAASFEDPFSTLSINANGTLHVLEAIKQRSRSTRLYFAATSEMFGGLSLEAQNEQSPFHPRSPYGVSKVAGFELVRNYREAYGLFACSGILFNHESPRRGAEFVTRKITKAVARIARGSKGRLVLGNIHARRDWGFAQDYVLAMWLMLQGDAPEDYVVATGESHSVEDFVRLAFERVGLDWSEHVTLSGTLLRPAEVPCLIGDASKARERLDWKTSISFGQLVEKMVDEDVRLATAQDLALALHA